MPSGRWNGVFLSYFLPALKQADWAPATGTGHGVVLCHVVNTNDVVLLRPAEQQEARLVLVFLVFRSSLTLATCKLLSASSAKLLSKLVRSLSAECLTCLTLPCNSHSEPTFLNNRLCATWLTTCTQHHDPMVCSTWLCSMESASSWPSYILQVSAWSTLQLRN